MSTQQTHEPYDLRQFFRAVGTSTFEAGLTSSPVERKDAGVDVQLLETDVSRVTAAPLNVAAFVDGVQSAIVVTHQAHRPVYLTYQAAGAVGANASLVGVRDRLTVVCSYLDVEYVGSVNPPDSPLPVQALPAEAPPEIERAAHQGLGQGREALERALVEDLVAQGAHPIVVDGSLMARPYQLGLHGVVKDTTSTKYLPDERCLYGLPEGWRSPIFALPAGSQGCKFERYSAYLRLHDATSRGWPHGLIRLESFTADDIDALAARAMAERQSPRSGDGRWDRHLASVATTEQVLRALRPSVFNF